MSSGFDDDDDPDLSGLEDVPVECYTNYGVIEIDNATDPNAPPIVIDFEVVSDHAMSYEEMEARGALIAARRIGALATYPDFARRFGTSPPFRVIPTGHTFGC